MVVYESRDASQRRDLHPRKGDKNRICPSNFADLAQSASLVFEPNLSQFGVPAPIAPILPERFALLLMGKQHRSERALTGEIDVRP